jgi:Uma2 family endonuclease
VTQTAKSRPHRRPRELIRAIVFKEGVRDDCVAVGRGSFEEFLGLEYEGGLAEWVDGEIRLYTSASLTHQKIVEFLFVVLRLMCESTGIGTVKLAPYAMEARRGGSGREPDLMFVAAAHRSRLRESHLVGPPDAVFEVVSEDSVRRDYEEKRAEYERAGIPEYWIVDSRPGFERVLVYALAGRTYAPVAAAEDGAIRSATIPGFWLRPEWLGAESPSVRDALREILGQEFG